MATDRSSRRRRIKSAALGALFAAACLAVGGCAWDAGDQVPALKALPLLSGTHLSLDHRVCDMGAHAYCALELVLAGSRYASSKELMHDEHHLLNSLGWHDVNAPSGWELEADSPGDKLRVTYATPYGDQLSIAFGWIKRSSMLRQALSQALVGHIVKGRRVSTPAISMLLQLGAG
jgi:hypothetical protein